MCFLFKHVQYSIYILVEKNNVLHIEVAHGGHLGFYEGGLLYPNPVTWLDRALVALIGSLTLNFAETNMKIRNSIEIWSPSKSSFSIRSILKTAWNILTVACCLLYHKAVGHTTSLSTFWQMYLSWKEWNSWQLQVGKIDFFYNLKWWNHSFSKREYFLCVYFR